MGKAALSCGAQVLQVPHIHMCEWALSTELRDERWVLGLLADGDGGDDQPPSLHRRHFVWVNDDPNRSRALQYREQRTANSIRQSALLGALPPSFLDQREILCSIGLLNWIPITSGVM
jgi:hypothetical protein